MNASGNFSRLNQPEWIVAEVFTLVEIFGVIWIGVGFVGYGKRGGKWKREFHHSNNKNTIYTPIYISTLLTAAFAFLRLLSDQVAFNIGYGTHSSLHCKVSIAVSLFLFRCFYECYYLVLWFRLHYLYEHISRVHAVHPSLRVFKWLMLVLFSLGVFTGYALLAYVLVVDNSERGCMGRNSKLAISRPLFVTFGAGWLAQAMMIFQFYLPLRFQLRGRNAPQIQHVARRSAAIASLTFGADVTVIMLNTFALPPSTASIVSLVMFDADMAVNLMCALLTFACWRDVLAWRAWGSPVGEKGASAEQKSPRVEVKAIETMGTL